ncbi:MAG TPA: family 43 glycosylhydrolase [Propionibacteriaceae bacterium]
MAAAAAAIWVSAFLTAPSASATGYTISSDSLADPGFATYGSTYYVYGTGPKAQNVPIYTSTTVTEPFDFAGYAFRSASLNGYSKVWAPHVVSRGGKYFMFFTASLNGGRHCIYWAVSSTNTSNSYSTPKLLLCAANQPGETWEAIDPSTYKTAAGNTYLVWRSGHIQSNFPIGDYQIRAAMLSFSGSSVTVTSGAPRIKLLGIEDGTVIEAPDLIRYDGKVYLFVSRGDYRDSSYRTDVYIADSIHDEFRFLKQLMASGQGFGSGPGGAEVLGVTSTTTRIAWHYRNSSGRHTRVGVISWTKTSPVASYVPSVV